MLLEALSWMSLHFYAVSPIASAAVFALQASLIWQHRLLGNLQGEGGPFILINPL